MTAGPFIGPLTLDEYVAEIHAKRYPDGCQVDGHHCFPCLARLGQRPYVVRSHVRGARAGYKGWPVIVCTECDYREG